MTSREATAGRRPPGAGDRLWVVDALKAIAAQMIVLHHLTRYGPTAEAAGRLAPDLAGWLSSEARIAVQVFFVIGGWLAARSLAPDGRLRAGASAWRLAAGRYLRLVLPLAAMLAIAVVAAIVARQLADHPSLPEAPTLAQVLAHLLLLQDLAGIDALSTGVWYVAIDFQLYVLLLLMLAMGGARVPWAVLALAALSMLVINRQPAWDIGAPYFVGAYGLGALAAWWGGPGGRVRRGPLALLAGVVVLALAVEMRERLVLAALTAAVLLAVMPRAPALPRVVAGWVAWAGRTSYALFLVHYPVIMLVGAVQARLLPDGAGWDAAALMLAWGGSLWAAQAFHLGVERPALRCVNAIGGLRPA